MLAGKLLLALVTLVLEVNFHPDEYLCLLDRSIYSVYCIGPIYVYWIGPSMSTG